MPVQTPTVPPPRPAGLSASLKRNIQALEDRRRAELAAATPQERIAEVQDDFDVAVREDALRVRRDAGCAVCGGR